MLRSLINTQYTTPHTARHPTSDTMGASSFFYVLTGPTWEAAWNDFDSSCNQGTGDGYGQIVGAEYHGELPSGVEDVERYCGAERDKILKNGEGSGFDMCEKWGPGAIMRIPGGSGDKWAFFGMVSW